MSKSVLRRKAEYTLKCDYCDKQYDDQDEMEFHEQVHRLVATHNKSVATVGAIVYRNCILDGGYEGVRFGKVVRLDKSGENVLVESDDEERFWLYGQVWLTKQEAAGQNWWDGLPRESSTTLRNIKERKYGGR